MADWSELPSHLLGIVARKLDFKPDNLFFTAVCSSWRSAGVEARPHVCRRLYPRLVIPGDIKESETRNCVQPVEGDDGYITYLHKNPPKELLVPHQSYVCGSSLGWLVLIDDNFDMQLYNPVSTKKFDLPSSKTLPPATKGFRKFCKYYVNKAIISVDPTASTPSQTTVLLIYWGACPRLAFCKLGDKKWTPIVTTDPRYYEDAIFYKDKFYALSDPGHCDIVDIANQTQISYAEKPEAEIYSCKRYLVGCEGNLFLVVRPEGFDCRDDDYGSDTGEEDGDEDDNVEDEDGSAEDEDDNIEDEDGSAEDEDENVEDEDGSTEDEDGSAEDEDGDEDDTGNRRCKSCNHELVPLMETNIGLKCGHRNWGDCLRSYKTLEFRVYKLEEAAAEDERRYWKRVKNIGDNAFFVGINSSFSISTTLPGCTICKPNSIYFTDDQMPFEDKLEPIRHDIGVFNIETEKVDSVFSAETKLMRPPPFWFTPNPSTEEN